MKRKQHFISESREQQMSEHPRFTGFCRDHRTVELINSDKPQYCPFCDRKLLAITEWRPCLNPKCGGRWTDWQSDCAMCGLLIIDGWTAEDYAICVAPDQDAPGRATEENRNE